MAIFEKKFKMGTVRYFGIVMASLRLSALCIWQCDECVKNKLL